MSAEPIEGLSDLEAALDAFPDRIARSAVQRVLRRAAAPLAEYWAALARVRSGKFRRSIKIASRLERAVRHFQASQTAPAAVAYIGVTKEGYPEALTEEFGTPHEKAQAPGRKAWETRKEEALAIFVAEIGPEVEKTAARLAKRLSR